LVNLIQFGFFEEMNGRKALRLGWGVRLLLGDWRRGPGERDECFSQTLKRAQAVIGCSERFNQDSPAVQDRAAWPLRSFS